MIRLVTYSDDNMSASRSKCVTSALRNGISDIHQWDREMLEATEFYQLNREILDQQRGSGYWLWKPYIIYKALLDMTENDILIYSDAGVEFIGSVSHIINKMREDVFLFGNNYNHVDWCKMDVLSTINYLVPEIDTDILEAKQVQASVIFFRGSNQSKDFVKWWLMYCQCPNLIDDNPSVIPNVPTFAEHRHDQAILTSLAIEHKLPLHYWPAQYNNGAFVYDKIEQYENDSYPIIFHHHRKRNNEW